MPSTLVALATYNERDNLPALVDDVLNVLPSADILVVDDNSPDGTGRWCDARAADEPRLACMHRPEKQGLGSATIAAMRHAMADGYEIVTTMDADFSHDPAELPRLVSALREDDADVAIGSRYCEGGKIDGWPFHRRVASRLVNAVARRLLKLPTHDCSGAFRAYRVDVLKRIDLDAIRASGYAYLEEILCHLTAVGAKFTEVPITFRDRRAGRSKLGAGEAVRTLATILRLARMTRYRTRNLSQNPKTPTPHPSPEDGGGGFGTNSE